jgi:O-antigen ligase
MTLFTMFLLTPVALYGILQYYFGLDHLFAIGSGFDVYGSARYAGSEGLEWRPPSTMVSPHSLASALTMAALMGMGLIGYFNRNRLLQILLVAMIPILGMGILITAVRNAAGSVVFGVLALLAVVRRLDLAIIAGVVGVIAVLQVDAMTGGEALQRIRSIVENPQYTSSRVLTPWRSSLHLVARHPLGAGIATGAVLGRVARSQGITSGGFTPEERTPWVENEYGRALLELGVPGFIFFIWMLVAATRNNFQAYREAVETRDKWMLAGFFASGTSTLARLLVGSALYGWPEGMLFFYYTAMAARIPQIEQQEMLERQAPSTEARATVLGTTELPWARDAAEADE